LLDVTSPVSVALAGGRKDHAMNLREYTRHAQSANRARRLIQHRGITPQGYQIWTPNEDEICKKHGNDYGVLRRKLPHRSYRALAWRCQRLGLRPKRNLTSAKEISLLRKLAKNSSSQEIIAAFPHRTVKQLQAIRSYYGIPLPKRRLIPTGFPIVDTIRARCFELNYSMGDLDKLAKTRGYFRRAGWRSAGMNYRAIGRAVAALDGELTIHWRDE